MKKFIFIFFLIIEINSVFHSKKILATSIDSRYISKVSNYNYQIMQIQSTKNLPIVISADYAEGSYPNDVVFIGNVNIRQGNNYLKADKIQLYRRQSKNIGFIQLVDAVGNVCYSNNQIILNGSKGWMNLNTKDIKIWNGSYQMINHQGHGRADLIEQQGENCFITLKNASFTSCPSNSEFWSIVGSKIIHNRKKQITEIWNARFKFYSIPIFYSPYLQLPIGSMRRSGFLIPNFKYRTSKYFEVCLPYYWNLFPNIDVTSTIQYHIHKHNDIMWKNEFRYLTHIGNGSIELDYLPFSKFLKDKQYLLKSNHHSWLFYWKHTGTLNHVWHFNVDYTKINNPFSFKNFDSKYSSNIDGYATQKFNASYETNSLTATISTKQFQVFDQKSVTNYFAKPQLDISWRPNNIGPFNINVYAQAVRFVNTNANMPELKRLHFEPTVNLSLINNLVGINLKLMATHYQQKNFDWHNTIYNTNYKNFVNRVMPQLKIDSKLIFKSSINWAKDHTQILEARMQYLYVPYRDQSKIQNCDSSFLLPDYNSFFRDRLYIGIDRIASMKQLKTNLVTRIYDDAAIERFSIAIGQIYCFNKSSIGNDIVQWEKYNKTGSLVWVGSTYWHMSNNWNLRSNLHYDVILNKLVTSNSAVEYLHDKSQIIQLTYRNVNSEYIQSILPEYALNKKNKRNISQIGSIASWPITNRWSIAGACYFNTNTKLVNQIVGLQYNSCCYAVRIVYEQKINNQNINNDQFKYNKTINFNIELRGLGPTPDWNIQQILSSNIIPYRSLL